MRNYSNGSVLVFLLLFLSANLCAAVANYSAVVTPFNDASGVEGGNIAVGGSRYADEWSRDETRGKAVVALTQRDRFGGVYGGNKRYHGTYYTSSGRLYKCIDGNCK